MNWETRRQSHFKTRCERVWIYTRNHSQNVNLIWADIHLFAYFVAYWRVGLAHQVPNPRVDSDGATVLGSGL